jgi:XTP/dITP diphosphohydrolase
MKSKRILLATGNRKKGEELADILDDRFIVDTLADAGLADLEIIENAATFAGNARIKVDTVAAALKKKKQLDTYFAILGDDSGLVVDALQGAPGIHSARFAENHQAGQGDSANNLLLLNKLGDRPLAKRQGRFVCHLCLYLIHVAKWHTTEGTVEGKIAVKPSGNRGFGYDPLFMPDDAPGKHMAELSSEHKHRISHRGHAMRQIAVILDVFR